MSRQALNCLDDHPRLEELSDVRVTEQVWVTSEVQPDCECAFCSFCPANRAERILVESHALLNNVPTEGFWGIIKSEMYYLQTFKDEKSLRSAIEKYIHFYNYERFQERFETRTPMEVRMAALNSNNPVLYPIPENKRIQKYKARFAA